MASLLPHLFLLLLLVSFVCSSRVSLNDLKKTYNLEKGFRVGLRHVDSNGNYTKLQLLQRGIKRGKHRLARFSSLVTSTSSNKDAIRSPVHAGSGEFLIDIAIGTPPETYSAIMDTGSDLIWTQCQPCIECYKQSTPIFDPSHSSSFSKLSCSNDLCKSLNNHGCNGGCEYQYAYGDGSSTQGSLSSETFTFENVSVPKIGFGCGYDNEGGGFPQGEGIVGLGRGPLSLVSQIQSKKFSYCLTSVDDPRKTSSLIFGSLANSMNSEKSITTALIENPINPSFYYLSIKGISVGNKRLEIPKSAFEVKADGSGGLIIDSGTTITTLDEDIFKIVKDAFVDQMKLPVSDVESTVGLEACFALPSDIESVRVPKLKFHFDGADLDLPVDNYIVSDSSEGVICLAMGSTKAGISIFGNVQQQNIFVLHDLEKQTVSFTPTQCDKL